MNIAHCIHGLGLGGAQKVITSIVRGIASREHRFFVYACEDGVLREQVEDAGATARIVPRISRKFDPLLIGRFARHMRDDRIELAHAHLFGDSLHGYLAARRVGSLPMVITLHIGTEGCNRLQRLGYRWLFPRCDRVVACSEAVRQSFIADFGTAAERVLTIPNGIEDPGAPSGPPENRHELRASLGVGPEDTLLAGIGRLERQKGFDYLIRAIAALPDDSKSRVRLVLFGEGAILEELQQQARRAGVSDRVLFAGFRPDIRELMAAIDVVVFSSLWEGLPIALLEAMAAARCIVTTDVPGNLEAVRDTREALVVPSRSVDRLSAALNAVITEPDLRLELGENSRRRFLERFAADQMVESYEALYREVLREQKG